MLRAAGAVLVIFACCAFGFRMSSNLSERLMQLKMLRRTLMFLKGEISFGKATLPEALAQISYKVEEPFSEFLRCLADKAGMYAGKSFAELFEEAIDEVLIISLLTKKDLESLKEVGKHLGYLDIPMQLSTIDLYLAELDMTIAELDSTLTSKKKLYQSLGIMSGLFLAILLA